MAFNGKTMVNRSILFLIFSIVFISSSTVMADGGKFIVYDQRGHAISLHQPVNRIITIPVPMAAVVIAIDGSTKRLIGMHPSSRESISEGFLRRVYPEALAIRTDVIRGGVFTPNIESILEMHPDLIVQWTQPENLITTLESAGLVVAGLVNSPPTQDVNEHNLTIVGQLLGRDERIKILLEKNHLIFDRVRIISTSIPINKKPKALYIRSFRESMRVVGKNTYQDYWITLAGAINVAHDVFTGTENSVNVEQIISWNPDVIFIGTFDDAVPDNFLNSPALASVSAIKNRKVYKLPHGGYRWDPGSHESRLTWQWAAMIIHPERFEFDLRAEMKEDYKFFYNYSLSDAEIDEILQCKLNGHMANYNLFQKKRESLN